MNAHLDQWRACGSIAERVSACSSIDDVHCWAGKVGAPSLTEAIVDVLSDEERSRASRFRDATSRSEFIASHATLRMVVAAILQSPPNEISLAYDKKGRPYSPNNQDLSFSLSHSGGSYVLAFAVRKKIGVDIERIRPFQTADRLVDTYFSVSERTWFERQAATERDGAFFKLWTRKEAYLKALGVGLSHPLDSFNVVSGPDGRFLVTPLPDEPWFLSDIYPFEDFAGAIAVQGAPQRVHYSLI